MKTANQITKEILNLDTANNLVALIEDILIDVMENTKAMGSAEYLPEKYLLLSKLREMVNSTNEVLFTEEDTPSDIEETLQEALL